MNRAYVGVLSTPDYLIGILGVAECLKKLIQNIHFML